jgi:hypothetical protein
MSTFVLSSERNEEVLRNKNIEDNRHFMQTILLVKNYPVALSVHGIGYYGCDG